MCNLLKNNYLLYIYTYTYTHIKNRERKREGEKVNVVKWEI